MTAPRTEITRDDIMPFDEYARVRRAKRVEITEVKRNRRLGVGPHATFYFENFETMWHQVHEMLYIERGGEAQIPDELRAYNPLIPKGRELVATVMFEIADADVRRRILATLGGIEDRMFIRVGDETIRGVAEADVDRTTADGKASSVQFVHFPFTEAQVARFRDPAAEVVVGFDHPEYGHMAVMPAAVREALSADFGS